MYKVFLSLGSNIGDRIGYLSHAIEEIESLAIINSISSIYETEPFGFKSIYTFYNMVISIDTLYRPLELLAKLKQIEKKLGRKQTKHIQDREIDIDILLYKGWSFETKNLLVPHPELEHRRFVLEPFNEIAPTAIHPILGQTIASLLRNCHDTSRVMRTLHGLNIKN